MSQTSSVPDRDYFLTVGQRYRTEFHPMGLHPDGWMRIRAKDMNQAREKAFAAMGIQFAFIYKVEEFSFHLHPRGELGVIE